MRLCFLKTLWTFNFFQVFYVMNTLQIYYFFRVLLLIHQIKHAILILLNIISLTRTKTLVNNNLEYKLRTSE